MKHSYLFLFWIFIISSQGKAQDSITDQEVKVNQQVWIDYNFKNLIANSKVLNTQVGFRTISPDLFNKYLAISTLTFPQKKGVGFLNLEKAVIESFQVGLGVIYTENYDADDNLEIRFIQGFKFIIPALIRKVDFMNYVRFEERFQNSFDGSGWSAGFRFRYRISTNFRWKEDLHKAIDGIYFPVSFEMFFNFKKSDRFNDLLRLSPGIGYRLKNDWKFELYTVFNQTKNNTETNNGSSDFILRLRVFNGNVSNLSKEEKLNLIPELD